MAHHPASNGLAESTNRKILEILRHLSGRLHETWEDWLSQVAACINSSVNSSTGKTPYYIVYGCDKKLPYDVLLQPPSPCITQRIILSCSSIASKPFMVLFVSAWELQERRWFVNNIFTFDVGDSVMLRSPARSCKFEPKFTGPYVITAKLHGHKFKDPGTSTSQVVHADRLKKVRDAL